MSRQSLTPVILPADPAIPMEAATKQYVDAVLAGIGTGLSAYPVGSIYIGLTPTNPNTFFGGTWIPFAKGRVLVSLDDTDPDFDTAREVGGEKTHVLLPAEMPVHTHVQNSHNHTQNSHNHTQDAHNHTQDPHTHTLPEGRNGTTFAQGGAYNATGWVTSGTSPVTAPPLQSVTPTNNSITPTNNVATATNVALTAVNQNAGSDLAHNNLQPFAVVYMWERTA